MRRIVGTVLVAILIGAILWAADARWGLWSQAAHAPTPTPTAPAGAWREAPELIGTLYLAACHDWMDAYTALRPVPPALVQAVAQAWPERPAIEGFLALSQPLYIPRTGDDVGRDVDAWLDAHAAAVDCAADIWTDADVQAIRGEEKIAFFGLARPLPSARLSDCATVKLHDYQTARLPDCSTAWWETVFAAVRWK